MRVMQIGGALAGAQKDIELSIHSFLNKQGISNIIVYAIGEDYEDKDIIRYESRLESIYRRGCWKYFGHNDSYAYLQTKRLISIIEKYKPDIIHIHVVHHGLVYFDSLANYLINKKIRIIFTVHDLWAITGGCYHYTAINCNQYLHGCSQCPATKSVCDCEPKDTSYRLNQKKLFYEKASGLVFICVSQWVQNEVNKVLKGKYEIKTIYNALQPVDNEKIEEYIDDPLIQKIQTERHDRTIIVGVAASWTHEKGIDDFQKLAQYLGRDYWVILVGNVQREIKEQTGDNITYLGYISNKALLWQIYRHCDVYVSMSREETFGMTFVEAALNGLRCVGYNSTAIPEILEKVNGIAVDELFPEKIAGAIMACREQGFHLTKSEIDGIAELFSQRRMAEEYYEVYRQLLADISMG